LDWSMKPSDEPSLKDEDISRIVDIGGPGDGKIDSCWPDDNNKLLWIIQVKGSEILLDQDVEDIDEDEDIEMPKFGDGAILELGHALNKLQNPPEAPTDRFRRALGLYQKAITNHYKIKLAAVVFGDRQPALDEAKRALEEELNSNRTRFPQHSIEIFDFTSLNDLLDTNFQKPVGTAQIATNGWEVFRDVQGGLWIALVPAADLVGLRSRYDKRIYHGNFRFMLGATPVTLGMKATLMDPNEKHLFHLYHNGITILGTNVNFEAGQLRLSGLQVVNGLQTVETMWEICEQGKKTNLLEGVRVLVRFIDTDDPQFDVPSTRPLDERIAEYSNKQNPITLRDLRSNDLIQKMLQRDIDSMGFKYQRKRGQYNRGTRGVVDNERGAQRMLAFWHKKPSEAKAQKKLLFAKRSENAKGYYEDLFRNNLQCEAVLIPYLVYDSMPSFGEGRNAEIADYGDFVLLAMMASILKQRYGITGTNVVVPRNQATAEALVDTFRDQRFERQFKAVWKALHVLLKRYVVRELERRAKNAKSEGKREPTIRNILVGFKYAQLESRIIGPSSTKALARKLPKREEID